MTLLRCFRFDLSEGFRVSWPALAAVGVLGFVNSLYFYSLLSFFPDGCASFGSFLVSFCEGVAAPNPQDLSRFRFPVAWLLGIALVLYATLRFPCRDAAGFGESVIVRCGKRATWWLSKCLWVAVCAVGCFVVAIASAGLAAAVTGSPLALTVESLQGFAFCDPDVVTNGPWEPLAFLLAYAAMLAGLSLLQLALSFLLRPSLAYLATLSLAFASALASSPLLPCEYLMAARSSLFVDGGVSPWQGLAFAVLLALCSLMAGGAVFVRKDLVNTEVDE